MSVWAAGPHTIHGAARSSRCSSESLFRRASHYGTLRPTDWILLAVCGVLLVAGPAMALQEFTRYERAAGITDVSGVAPDLDPAFRSAWREVLLGCVIIGGIVGTIVAVRIARQPRVRSVSGRLIMLLLVGMTLLDFAFLADGMYFLDESYAIRGATIVWMYPLAAVLMAGSLMRLTEVEGALGTPRA